jgi:hypothetical protein
MRLSRSNVRSLRSVQAVAENTRTFDMATTEQNIQHFETSEYGLNDLNGLNALNSF